jgi:hypothetical protein
MKSQNMKDETPEPFFSLKMKKKPKHKNKLK